MRTAKITTAILAVIILIGFSTLAFNSGVTGQKLDFQTPKLQSTEAKLKDVNIRYEKLNTELHQQTSTDKKKIQELKEQQNKLQQEREELQKQVQAKADEKAHLEQVAEATANKATGTATASAAALPSGSHTDWMAAAGIDPANYGYVDYIVSHESGWNPCSYNPGHSDCSLSATDIGNHACGLGQQLPCGKWAGAWNDPIAALVAMNTYVSKFGGWAGAYNYWVAHGNY